MFNYSLKQMSKIALIVVLQLLLSSGNTSIAKGNNLSHHLLAVVGNHNNKSDASLFYHHEKSNKKSSVSTPFSLRKKGRDEKNEVIFKSNAFGAASVISSNYLFANYKGYQQFSYTSPFFLRGPPELV